MNPNENNDNQTLPSQDNNTTPSVSQPDTTNVNQATPVTPVPPIQPNTMNINPEVPVAPTPTTSPTPPPIFPQSSVSMPSPSPANKNKIMIIGAIVAGLVVLGLVVVGVILLMNKDSTLGTSKTGTNSQTANVSDVDDVKTIDDAVAFAKNESGYKNPVLSAIEVLSKGSKKTYRVSIIDIDGYKKDSDSDFYVYPEKYVDFDSEGQQSTSDGTKLVTSSEYKQYYGYGGNRSLEEVFNKAKNKLESSNYKLGDVYLFEFNDSTFDDESESWELIWSKAGQDEESNDLKAWAVELKDSDLSVVRKGDASLYVW